MSRRGRRGRQEWVGQDCCYCGDLAQGMDHIAPVSVFGEHNIQVPSCGDCNSVLGAIGALHVAWRVRVLYDRQSRRWSEALAAPTWTPRELDALGPALRTFVEAMLTDSANKRRRIAHIAAMVRATARLVKDPGEMP